MWIQFLLENAHFAINLFASLVFFAVFWLHFDAWKDRRVFKETLKIIGFLTLAVSFVLSAVVIESTLVVVPVIAGIPISALASVIRIIGYVLVISGLLADPLQDEPGAVKSARMLTPMSISMVAVPTILQPILAAIVFLLYLRRATVGLEDHLKPLAYSFGLLSLAELLAVGSLFQQSVNLSVFRLTAPFGPIWLASHAVLLASCLLLCRWVFGYLLKQFQAQLFMVYTTTILVVFLITTVSFTGLLLRNMESEALRQIETDVKVLDYAIGSQKDQLIADAEALGNDTALLDALEAGNRKDLGDITTSHLLAKKLSTLLVISETGQVLARGEDRERLGDSLSQDALVKRGLLGEAAATVVARDGVIAPDISIRAIVAIKNPSGSVIGAIVVGRAVDTAFVDGLKKATGLDASIYGDNTVSATTFMSPDGKNRLIGMKEEHGAVKSQVLQKGESFSGSIAIRETVYTSAFLPLKDVDNNPVGMVFVGRPESSILQAAGQSIQYTFIITALLLIASVFPAFRIARSIADQL